MQRMLLIVSFSLRRTWTIVLEPCPTLVINQQHHKRVLTIHPAMTRIFTCLPIRRRSKSIRRCSNNVSVIRTINAVNNSNNNSSTWTNSSSRTIDPHLFNRRIWSIVNSIHPCHSIRMTTFKKCWRITSVTSAVLGERMNEPLAADAILHTLFTGLIRSSLIFFFQSFESGRWLCDRILIQGSIFCLQTSVSLLLSRTCFIFAWNSRVFLFYSRSSDTTVYLRLEKTRQGYVARVVPYAWSFNFCCSNEWTRPQGNVGFGELALLCLSILASSRRYRNSLSTTTTLVYHQHVRPIQHQIHPSVT